MVKWPPHHFRFGGDRLRSAAKRGVAALLRWYFCWRVAAFFYRLIPCPFSIAFLSEISKAMEKGKSVGIAFRLGFCVRAEGAVCG